MPARMLLSLPLVLLASLASRGAGQVSQFFPEPSPEPVITNSSALGSPLVVGIRVRYGRPRHSD